jgi:predicted transcriptional regulator
VKGRLAELELECMQVLWKHPGASVAQVRSALARPLAYTTVMTVLDRMTTKGLVERRKNGRAWLYNALLDLESARRNAVLRVVTRFFDADPAALARYTSRLRLDEPAAPSARAPRARAVSRKSALAIAPSYMDDSLL